MRVDSVAVQRGIFLIFTSLALLSVLAPHVNALDWSCTPSSSSCSCAPSVSGGTGSESCILLGDFNTLYTQNYKGFATLGDISKESTSVDQPVSPVSQVNSTNEINAPWFITCPNTPQPNPTTDFYFDTNPQTGSSDPYSHPYATGDLCAQNILNNGASTFINLPFTVSWAGSLENDPSYSVASLNGAPSLEVIGSGLLSIENLNYTPDFLNNITNGFSTTSYIFDQIPSFEQHDIWTWEAGYIDFSNAEDSGLVPMSETFTDSFSDFQPSGYYHMSYCTPGETNTMTGACMEWTSFTCTYIYGYTAVVTLDSLDNNQIPFEEVVPGDSGISGQPLTNEFSTNIIPYFTFNFSMPSLYGQNLNLSYDIFSPWNYYTALNSISNFPIGTPDGFFAANIDGISTGVPVTGGAGTSYLSFTPINDLNYFTTEATNVLGSTGQSLINGKVGSEGPGSGTVILAGSSEESDSAVNQQDAFSQPGSIGLLVPLYTDPDVVDGMITNSYWTELIQYKGLYSSVPVIAVINPDSGPGSSTDTAMIAEYTTAIAQLQQAGIIVIGYVSTCDGVRPLGLAEGDVESWHTEYPAVNGIFFDDMANQVSSGPASGSCTTDYGGQTQSDTPSYYQSLSTETQNYGYQWTVGNPGTGVVSQLDGLFTILNIFENNYIPTAGKLSGASTQTQSYIAYDVSSLPSTTQLDTTTPYVSWLYITDQPTDQGSCTGPYACPPSYFQQEFIELSGSSGSPLPAGPSGVGGTPTAVSYGQISIQDPLSSAVLPNDYLYVMNYSSGSKNYYIEELKLEPRGDYNVSNMQPEAEAQAAATTCDPTDPTQCSTEWTTSWENYWNNVISLQNDTVYDVKNIDLTPYMDQMVSDLQNSGVENSMTDISASDITGFVPMNITVDYQGDLFITGYLNTNIQDLSTTAFGACGPLLDFSQNTCTFPAIMEITNTTSDNPNTNPVYLLNTTAEWSLVAGDPITPEITTSPTGQLVFTANQSDGYIYVFGGDSLGFDDAINLTYQKSVPGTEYSLATLNVSSYLLNGGLYGIDFNGQPGAYNAFNVLTVNPDYCSGACPNLDLDQPIYHHPVGIADVNGFLYVLDNWAGTLDSSEYCNPTEVGTGTIGRCDVKGVYFDMLTLRVLNSTGSDIPVNPTLFNDMWTEAQCTSGAPISTTCSLTAPAGVSCEPSADCQIVGSACQTTAGVPGNTYACVSTTSAKSTTYYDIAATSFYPYETYPPFGWVLSANITYADPSCVYVETGIVIDQAQNLCFESDWHTNPQQSVSICSSGGATLPTGFGCTYNPNNDPNLANDKYKPIGPPLTALIQETTPDMGFCIAGICAGPDITRTTQRDNDFSNAFVPVIFGTGFEVNYNDTVTILFSNIGGTVLYNNPDFEYGTKSVLNAVGFRELAMSIFNIENYTNLVTGYPPSVCFTNSTMNSSTGIAGNYCLLMKGVAYMTEPVATVSNPFYYLENLGSEQFPTILSAAGSALTGGGGQASLPSQCQSALSQSNQGGGPLVTGPTSGSSASNCYESSSSGLSSQSTCQFNKVYDPDTGTCEPLTTGLSTLPTRNLSSQIGGYLLEPYQYQYTESQSYTDGGYVMSGPSLGPIVVTGAPQPSGGTGTTCQTYPYPGYSQSSTLVYTSTLVNGQSNLLSKIVEGGDTYLQYIATQGYYTPNLSDLGLIISPQVLLNIKSNRLFENIYVNATVSDQTNRQTVLNATNESNYGINEYYQWFCPGSSDVCTGAPINTAYNVVIPEAIVNPQASPSVAGMPTVATNLADNLTYKTNGNLPTLLSYVNLFDWYKQMVYDNQLYLLINSSSYTYSTGGISSTANSIGYQRLIYVLHDRFNNTIYAPIDVDIANTTTLSLTLHSTPSSSNPNQTVITVNGTAKYQEYFGGKSIPLQNAQIYLYYDADLNYLNPSASPTMPSIGGPANVALCVYDSLPGYLPTQDFCQLGDPLFSTQQTAWQNTVNYEPDYNTSSETTCGPAPSSLLAVPTPNCNIYDLSPTEYGSECPVNQYTGAQQFCKVVDPANGSGICTSQLGLIGIVTTDQNGNFSTGTAPITACGNGQATIIAKFYGLPSSPLEPETASQSLLGYAADPSSGQSVQFPIVNFTWAPYAVEANAQIGEFLLSYGDIGLPSILVCLLLVLLIWLVRGSKR